MGIGLGVGALVSFGKEVVNLGSQLQDLHDQTGVSVQALSGLKSVLEENGSNLDTFAKGIFNAQKELGSVKSQADPAIAAIEKLSKINNDASLTFQNLINASPDEFAKKVSSSLAGVNDVLTRNALGADLLKKSFRELSPALQAIGNDFDKFKAGGLSAEVVRQLDEIGDSITRFKNELLIAAAPNVLELLKALGEVFGSLNVAIKELTGSGIGAFFTNLTTLLVGTAQAALSLYGSLLKIANAPTQIANAFSGGFFSKFGDPLKNLIEDNEKRVAALGTSIQRLQGAFRGAQAGANLGGVAGLGALPKAPFQFTGDLKTAEDAIERYRKKLQEVIDKQEEARIKLTLGDDAARQVAQAYDLLALKAELVAKKVPIPREVNDRANEAIATLKSFGIVVDNVGEKDLKKLAERALEAAHNLDVMKLVIEQVGEVFDKLDKELGDAGLKLKDATLDAGRAVDALGTAQAANAVQAKLLGSSFNQAAEDAAALETAIKDLSKSTDENAIKKREELATKLPATRAAAVQTDLQKQLNDAAKEAEILGGAIDLPRERIDALTDAIKRLIAQGLDPLDPKIQQLKVELEDAKAAEQLTDAFKGIGNALGDFLDKLGEGKIQDSLKSLGNAIKREITQAFIIKPFQDWLQKIANELAGSIFGGKSGGLGGALGALGGAVKQTPEQAAAVAAIESTQATATAAMESEQAIIETTITGLQTEMSAAIQAELTTATTAIEAVQEVAITAIEAAGASKGAGGGLGGLLGGGGGGLGGLLGGGGEGGGLGGLLGGGGEAGAIGGEAGGSILELGAAFFHSGGVVGETSTRSRMVHVGALSRVPRYHGGLAGDESLAILQKGETVLPRGMRGKHGINVYMTVNAMDAGSFRTSERYIATSLASRIGRLANQ